MKIFVEPFLFSIKESIEIAKKFNIGLELMINRERLISLKSNKELLNRVKSVKELSLHAPIHDMSPGGFDEDVRKITFTRYIKTLQIGKDVNARWVLYHLSFNPLEYGYHTVRNRWIKNAVKFFEELVTQKGNMIIHLENAFEDDPDIFLNIFEKISDEQLRMCLDIGHVNVYSKKPLDLWIKALSPYISEVHLHNNDGLEDHHWALDKGSIDINHVLELLEHNIGKYIITLEPVTLNDLEKNLKWLKENGWIKK